MNDQATFPAMLHRRAVAHPNRPAVTFLDDRGVSAELTYGQLWDRAVGVAWKLTQLSGERQTLPSGVSAGPRAMLLFPAGIDFVTAFVGTQIAGWVPVPTSYPKPHRAHARLDASSVNCAATVVLTDSQSLAGLDRSKSTAVAKLPCIAIDSREDRAVDYRGFELTGLTPETVALLQYTSGSTSEPKGVVITHQNLMTNLEAIRRGFGFEFQEDSHGASRQEEPLAGVFWLPHYHDMGLIGGILAPLYIGGRTVLLSPQSFIRQPLRWLETVSRYRAMVTGAPNFAFDLCADRLTPTEIAALDLSPLRLLFCGAEPISATSLNRFAQRLAGAGLSDDIFYPCYGLAESTLLAAGGDGPGRLQTIEIDRASLGQGRVRVVPEGSPKSATLVNCGRAAWQSELMIVDPVSGEELPQRTVGEIWIRGETVSKGYWQADPADMERFNAELVRTRRGIVSLIGRSVSQRTGGFYRTGDLGFFDGGDLYVTGRIKEVIIVRGRNYFPRDIEATVASVVQGSAGRVAAVGFRVDSTEWLGIVAEVPRHTAPEDLPGIVRRIRAAVIEEHEIDPREVVLVRMSSIPVTSSGKTQRVRCVRWFEEPAEPSVHRWKRHGDVAAVPLELPSFPGRPEPADFDSVNVAVRDWIVRWLTQRGGVEPDQIDLQQRFDAYGLDSLMAIRLIGDLEDACGVELTPMIAWEHPTIAATASLIAGQICKVNPEESWVPDQATNPAVVYPR